MTLAVEIAVGSSAQIRALGRAGAGPLFFRDRPRPMSLLFNGFEITRLRLSVLRHRDRRSSTARATGVEGLQLLSVYLILALRFISCQGPAEVQGQCDNTAEWRPERSADRRAGRRGSRASCARKPGDALSRRLSHRRHRKGHRSQLHRAAAASSPTTTIADHALHQQRRRATSPTAWAIHDAVRHIISRGIEITIIVQGMAYSMGSIVLQAASDGKRLAFPHSWIMITSRRNGPGGSRRAPRRSISSG
jgi:hypothetical protein